MRKPAAARAGADFEADPGFAIGLERRILQDGALLTVRVG
jgi:hypothetical protein